MRAAKEIVAGLDIGSAKISLCIGYLDDKCRPVVTQSVIVKSRGVERGQIVDPAEAGDCIEEALGKLQKRQPDHPVEVQSVYAALGGAQVMGSNCKGMVNLYSRSRMIGRKDVQRVIDNASIQGSTPDRDIVHVETQEFVVDGVKRSRNPVGMCGSRLEAHLHLVSADSVAVQSVISTVHRAGLDLDGVVFNGLATSIITLTEEEKQAGVVLLEFGASSINILFFCDGYLQYTNVISRGGQNITEEIARQCSIDLPQAEDIKMRYTDVCHCGEAEDSEEEKIIIKNTTARYESISCRILSRIIDTTCGALLDVVQREIMLSGILQRAGAGVVIAGGMAFMDGLLENVESRLGVRVRPAVLRGFLSHAGNMNNLFCSAAIGALVGGLRERQQPGRLNGLGGGAWQRMVAQIRYVYDQYF